MYADQYRFSFKYAEGVQIVAAARPNVYSSSLKEGTRSRGARCITETLGSYGARILIGCTFYKHVVPPGPEEFAGLRRNGSIFNLN